MKILLKTLGILSGALAMVLIAYIAYVLFTYHRIGDELPLEPEGAGEGVLKIGETYTASTYNLGFGAYGPDFTFFLDGGTESRARSLESCMANIRGAARTIADRRPDIALFQEVDLDSTRSFHLNQYDLLREQFPYDDSVMAVNYDSAYLFYPFTQPHGKSLSSIVTLSDVDIRGSVRRSLPVSTGFSKFLDLDRCYTVTELATDSGKKLYVYNVHLSAYGNDAGVREAQVRMLFGDMEEKIRSGAYVLCGGDFNHDLTGDSASVLNSPEKAALYTWAQPFPKELLPVDVRFCSGYEGGALLPTARNCDVPYVKGETFVIVIDGFFVSPDVEVVKVENVQTDFAYSDHNPVLLEFRLK